MRDSLKLWFLLLLVLFSVVSCKGKDESDSEDSKKEEPKPEEPTTPVACAKLEDLKLTSSAFEEGGTIPIKHSNSGTGSQNASPPLKWGCAADGVKGYALMLYDDTGGNREVSHWLVAFSSQLEALPEALAEDLRSTNHIKTVNGVETLQLSLRANSSYVGPGRDGGGAYRFYLFALDKKPNLTAATTTSVVDNRGDFKTEVENWIKSNSGLDANILKTVSLSGNPSP